MHSCAGTGTGDRYTTTRMHHVFPKRGVTVSQAHSHRDAIALFPNTHRGHPRDGAGLSYRDSHIHRYTINTGLKDRRVGRVPFHRQGLSQGHCGHLDSQKGIITQAQGHMEAEWPDLSKSQMKLPFDSAIPVQELYPTETPLHLTREHGIHCSFFLGTKDWQ